MKDEELAAIEARWKALGLTRWSAFCDEQERPNTNIVAFERRTQLICRRARGHTVGPRERGMDRTGDCRAPTHSAAHRSREGARPEELQRRSRARAAVHRGVPLGPVVRGLLVTATSNSPQFACDFLGEQLAELRAHLATEFGPEARS